MAQWVLFRSCGRPVIEASVCRTADLSSWQMLGAHAPRDRADDQDVRVVAREDGRRAAVLVFPKRDEHRAGRVQLPYVVVVVFGPLRTARTVGDDDDLKVVRVILARVASQDCDKVLPCLSTRLHAALTSRRLPLRQAEAAGGAPTAGETPSAPPGSCEKAMTSTNAMAWQAAMKV